MLWIADDMRMQRGVTHFSNLLAPELRQADHDSCSDKEVIHRSLHMQKGKKGQIDYSHF